MGDGGVQMRKKQLRFERSRIHGWGLLAGENIEAEEFVIKYVGEVIRSVVSENPSLIIFGMKRDWNRGVCTGWDCAISKSVTGVANSVSIPRQVYRMTESIEHVLQEFACKWYAMNTHDAKLQLKVSFRFRHCILIANLISHNIP